MKRTGSFSFLILGAATLVLYGVTGCGGGGGASSAQNTLLQSRAELQQLAAGQKPTSEQSLQSLLTLFLLAIQQNPDSSEAHFGAAICMAGVVAQEADGYSGTVEVWNANTVGKAVAPAGGNTVSEGDIPPTPIGGEEPQPIPPHHVRGLFWNLDANLTNPYSLLHTLAPLSDLRGGLLAFYGYSGDDAARRQKMLDRLDIVVQQLAKVEADPNFSVTLPLQEGQKLTVGLPEVYLFDAYVQSLRAELALSLTYIRDPGTNWQPPIPYLYTGATSSDGNVTGGATGSGGSELPPTAPVQTPAALDKNKDGKLTPDEYLPPSPYLTLRSAALMQTAQQAILLMVEKETKGIDGVFVRPTEGNYLVPNSTVMHSILAEVQTKVLPLLQQAATGPIKIEVPIWTSMPYGVAAAGRSSKTRSASKTRKVFEVPVISPNGDGGSVVPLPLPEPEQISITINLAAWFTHPPADLKVFAPTLTLNAEGWPDEVQSVYPDLTFGGLFPEGFNTGLPF